MIIQISLLLLPAAITCGWFWGQHDKNSKGGRNNQQLRGEFFQGLNYLIDEKPDKAVDVFIQLVDIDADTIETHLALGNLFRRRGEVDRAIRVHQNLIARPQLPQKCRLLALYALAQDYFYAGVLDRAERLLLELLQGRHDEKHVLQLLMRIYEQEKEWRKAIQITKRLQIKNRESMGVTISQYYCELAEECVNHANYSQAQSYLKYAITADKHCIRANLLWASIEMANHNPAQAIRYYKKVEEINKEYLYLIWNKYIECLLALNKLSEIKALFLRYLQFSPELYLHALFDTDPEQAYEFIEGEKMNLSSLMQSSSLYSIENTLTTYINSAKNEDAIQQLMVVRQHLRDILKENIKYQCQHCGFCSLQLLWRCPSCHQWASLRIKLLMNMSE